jgi:hypothetical protein
LLVHQCDMQMKTVTCNTADKGWLYFIQSLSIILRILERRIRIFTKN